MPKGISIEKACEEILAENFVNKIVTNEDQSEEWSKKSKAAFESYKEIGISKRKSNQASHHLKLSHSKMISDREIARKTVQEINGVIAKIETSIDDFTKVFEEIEEHSNTVDDGVSRAQEIYNELNVEVIEVQDRINKKIIKADDYTKTLRVNMNRQQESIAANEGATKEKLQHLEKVRERKKSIQSEFSNSNHKSVKKRLQEMILNKNIIEKELSTGNACAEKEKEIIGNMKDLYENISEDTKKFEATLNEHDANCKKLQAQRKEEEKNFRQAFESKIDAEYKENYDANVEIAKNLERQLEKQDEIIKESEEIQKNLDEMTLQHGELIDCKNLKLESIQKINQDIETLKAADQNDSVDLITSLKKQIQDEDEIILQLQNQLAKNEEELKEIQTADEIPNETQNTTFSQYLSGSSSSDEEIQKLVEKFGLQPIIQKNDEEKENVATKRKIEKVQVKSKAKKRRTK